MECPSVGVWTVSTPEDSEGTAVGGEVYGLMWNGALAVHSLLFSGITPFGGMVAEAVASGGGVRCAH